LREKLQQLKQANLSPDYLEAGNEAEDFVTAVRLTEHFHRACEFAVNVKNETVIYSLQSFTHSHDSLPMVLWTVRNYIGVNLGGMGHVHDVMMSVVTVA